MNSCAAKARSVARKLALLVALVFAVSALLSLSSPRVCIAAEGKAQTDLESAEQALVNLDYEIANKTAERVIRQKGLSHEQLVRAYRVLALTHAVLDHETPAREAFQYLLTIDPDYQGDPNLGPKVQAPFMEARGFIRAQAVKSGIEVSVVLHAAEPGTLRVTTRDPTHLAKRVNVGWRWGSDGSFTVSTVPVSEGQTVTVPTAPQGTSRLDYYAQAVDDREASIFEVGNANVPKSATVEVPAPLGYGGAGVDSKRNEGKSVFASPVFWVIAGAVVIAGGVTAYAVTRPKDTVITQPQTMTLPPTSATLFPGLQCGTAKCN